MTDVQAWLDQVEARLDAVRREPAQEDRDRDHESLAWSDLYQHAPSDIARATNALQAVLDLHQNLLDVTILDGLGQTIFTRRKCSTCSPNGGCDAVWPCPTVRAIQDAIGDPQ